MPKTFTDQTATVTGTPLNSANMTGMLTSADIGVASGAAGLDANSNLLVPGHLILSGTAPSVANAGGSGVSSVSIAGCDSAGGITVTTSASPASGNLVTVTFAHAFGSSPRIVLSVQGNNPTLQLWISSVSTAAFTIAANATPGASQTYGINYHAIQTP